MNLVGLIINLLLSHNFKQWLKKIKLEASMYQGNISNVIAKQTVRHQPFYFIVRLFFKLPAYPFVNFFKGISRVDTKLQKSISVTQTDYSLSGTQTDHSSSGPPKDH